MISNEQLEEIVDAPVPLFVKNVSDIKRARLLRLCADSLDRAEPETPEVIAVAHHLASWALEIENSLGRDVICECGHVRRECICDKLAGEDYLETRNPAGLIALGWPRMVLLDLDSGDLKPADLLSNEVQNDYQKGATPADLRHQSMF